MALRRKVWLLIGFLYLLNRLNVAVRGDLVPTITSSGWVEGSRHPL